MQVSYFVYVFCKFNIYCYHVTYILPYFTRLIFALLHTTPHYCIRSPLYLTNVLYAQSSGCLHQ